MTKVRLFRALRQTFIKVEILFRHFTIKDGILKWEEWYRDKET